MSQARGGRKPGARKETLESIWPQLEAGLEHLLNRLTEGFTTKESMRLYSLVYDYCTSAPKSQVRKTGANFAGGELYYKLQDYLKDHVRSLLTVAQNRMDTSLLSYYKKQWDRFTTAMKVVNHIFQYLNRHWIKRESDDNQEVYVVQKLGTVIWKSELFDHIKESLTRASLTLIENDRNLEQIDTTLLQSVISTYVTLGLSDDDSSLQVYQADFEAEFLSATEIYYTTESSLFIEVNSIAKYMEKAEERLEQEKDRVNLYLHPSTSSLLIDRVEQVLIDKQKEIIWDSFQELLDFDKEDDLARMHRLLGRINALDPLMSVLERHVLVIGAGAIEERVETAFDDPKEYVECILNVHRKYNELVAGPFQGNPGFGAALDKACRDFINDNAVTQQAKTSSKSPELLAKYVDILLKKSPKNPEEQVVLDILNDIMLVFKYIEDKDVFQTFYSKMLAKRLIHGTSVSDFLEGQMIAKLKQNCGYEYTSKLARMFNDMSVSRDLIESFKTSSFNQDFGFDLSVLVLATGSWPLAPPTTNFTIPDELIPVEKAFQDFYQHSHSGRKLNWLMQFCKGEVKTGYVKGKQYTFQCSTYQMGILLQFNKEDILTGSQLQEQTNLTDSALISTLLSLIKTSVLLMAPKGAKNITKKHRFTLNPKFKNSRARVLINIPMKEEEKKGASGTHKMIEEDRKLQLQAAIVRTMKARNVLQHNVLIAEVINQLQTRFKPKVPVIKKCIDILIEKEYMERVEGQKDMYSYIA